MWVSSPYYTGFIRVCALAKIAISVLVSIVGKKHILGAASSAAARKLAAALAAPLFLSLLACGGERELLVFAAVSLRDPLTEISERYERRAGLTLNLSFGGSHSLARQIAAGAPADVFISAGDPPLKFLVENELVENSGARPLLGNQLVIVVPGDSGQIDSLESLASDAIERVAIADPALAPAGAYAEEALRATDVWNPLRDRLLMGKDVRAAMSYVAIGNADAGIVYRTDALTSDSLKIAHSIEPLLHSPVIYPAALVKGTSNPGDAAAYLDFLTSEEAISVFRRFGFTDPPP